MRVIFLLFVLTSFYVHPQSQNEFIKFSSDYNDISVNLFKQCLRNYKLKNSLKSSPNYFDIKKDCICTHKDEFKSKLKRVEKYMMKYPNWETDLNKKKLGNGLSHKIKIAGYKKSISKCN